jgi:hypothetical protein
MEFRYRGRCWRIWRDAAFIAPRGAHSTDDNEGGQGQEAAVNMNPATRAAIAVRRR